VANLTIKNVPKPVLRRLKARAALHRRSLNLEVISCLETLVQPTPLDAEALLARVREIRRTPARTRLTDRALRRLKTAGHG
jgi:plasmid stability protein